jgi:hypothetical protein
MEVTLDKKKMGRPPTGRVWRNYTIDKEVADYIDSLPDGDRSRFVNNTLAMRIAEMKVRQDFIESMKGKES